MSAAPRRTGSCAGERVGKGAPAPGSPTAIRASATSTRVVWRRPRVIQSAAMSPRRPSVLSPVRLSNVATTTRRGSSPCFPRGNPTATATTANTTAVAPRAGHRKRLLCCAPAPAPGVWGRGAVDVRLSSWGGPAASCLACTASINAFVSAAGRASYSWTSRFAKSSYAITAPARSPRRSSSAISRRNRLSSSGTSRSARRAHCAAAVRSPPASHCSTRVRAAPDAAS